MAKVAVELERALSRRDLEGTAGGTTSRLLAEGDGWSVRDVICTSGPQDRPFEEQHAAASIAVVAAGSFQYRSARGRELLSPGALLLGNGGQAYECAHEHSSGDRCVAFQYTRTFFDRLGVNPDFRALRLPPLRALSPIVAHACAGLVGADDVPWEEVSLRLVTGALQLAGTHATEDASTPPPNATARVTQVVRRIERHPDEALTLENLAQEAGLSPFHFLRLFERLTGTTPHQYVLRARLREAVTRLATEPAKVIDVALDCGFGDVSNFNRAFRAEFGVSPKAWRPRRSKATRARGRRASR